jgi:hypothetical protein
VKIKEVILGILALSTISISGEEKPNVGQDFTRPLTRIDLRAKVTDDEKNIYTIRLQRPFKLENGWTINTRVDLPYVFNNGINEDGLGTMLGQFMAIAPKGNKRWTYAIGAQIKSDLVDDEIGENKTYIAPALGIRFDLGEGFGYAVVRPYIDTDDSKYAMTGIKTGYNITSKSGYFLTIASESYIEENKTRIPISATVGKLIGKTDVISLELETDMYNEDERGSELEIRWGHFF